MSRVVLYMVAGQCVAARFCSAFTRKSDGTGDR